MGSEAPPPALKADAAAALGDLTPEFFGHLERLRPFGPGNPAPVLILTAVECLASRVVAERHLKVQLAQDGRMLEAIAFYQAAHHPLSGAHDVAVCVRLSFFQGRPAPELLLLDWGRP
jgi:single-stranded-DNA-specific exonuclease